MAPKATCSESAWVIHLLSHYVGVGLNGHPPHPHPDFVVRDFTLNQMLAPNILIHKSFSLMIGILAWTPLALFLIQ